MTYLQNDAIKITLNGEPKTVAATTISNILIEFSLPASKIAVELNLAIVPKSEYDTTKVTNGDRLEIVQFVGGG